MDNPHTITVEFGPGFHPDERGPLLMALERAARHCTGEYVEVFMHRKGDDSKLRVMMTADERAKL